MIKNVSRDDYLLARGANPRTGIVTPGVHSASSSFDETAELKTRGLVPPAKWRQRGDQWISLEFGQPTPLPTPASEAGHPDPSLRTPPRLAASRYNRVDPVPRPLKIVPHHLKQARPKEAPTPREVPGSYPVTPPANNVRSIASTSNIREIPRKPVGSPLKEPTTDEKGDAGLPVPPLMNDGYTQGMRSSSAPSPWKPYPFSPNDVGKGTPSPAFEQSASGLTAVLHAEPSHFLGQQLRSVSAKASSPMNKSTQNRDKELPCLPTNSGQSPSRRPLETVINCKAATRGRTPLNGDTRQEARVPSRPEQPQSSPHMNRGHELHGPRAMNPDYPYLRTWRPSDLPELKRPMNRPNGSRIMDVPSYDNPPPPGMKPIERRTPNSLDRQRIPRSVQPPAPISFDDILFAPIGISTSTTTSTAMSTDTSPGDRSRERNMYNAAPIPQNPRRPEHKIPMSYRDPSLFNRGNMGMATTVWSDELLEMRMPMTRPRPRAMCRPQMPERAEAMPSVPRIAPAQIRNRERSMNPAPSHQWSSIGTPITLRPQTAGNTDGPGPTVLQDKEGQELPPPPAEHVSKPPQVPPHSPETITLAATKTDTTCHMAPLEHGLFRKCSRCTSGFVPDRQRRVDGGVSSTGTAQEAHVNQLHSLDEHQHGNPGSQALCFDKKKADAPSEHPNHDIDHNYSVDKHVSTSKEMTKRRVSNVSSTSAGETSDSGNAPQLQRLTALKQEAVPRRGSQNPLVVVERNDRDHSNCCPQCCREQDCHGGCVGHPSPSATPLTDTWSSEGYISSRSGSITSLEGQPLTPLSERTKRLGFVKSAFKKGFQKSNITSKDAQSPIASARITRAADIDMMPSELCGGRVSPGKFWGEQGPVSGSIAAAAAAKSAIGERKIQDDSASMAAMAAKSAIGLTPPTEPKKPAVLVKKTRSKSSNSIKTVSSTAAADATMRKVTPNEGRRVVSPPTSIKQSYLEAGTSPQSLRRTPSVASSTMTLDPQLPGSAVAALAEMVLVPFDVSRMWLRTHPTISKSGWSLLGRVGEMLLVVLGTGEGCWRVVYVYSKTGKWRAPKMKGHKGKEGWGFAWDCVRSVAYTMILVAAAVLCVRVLRWVFTVVRAVWLLVRGVLWVGKVLLGGGTGW
ncbi:uncharacterized protein HMPREF1541_01395 [Cyphellophora europaea CBS 101466]|uniref:Uncharacterized protein n=1 Tax=Cyphellophora europaea (strain CBS 101466) TaxID=1220924 RepID=W2SH61_CYPE1|nr:uncharacterized protein HMPREF1541_01395 [Cyphellophora europaea CBS 101466]ETN47204.1 hypothetical protein HMPREF1541_01395 [Cyphellophora europaea CBS 101466]